MTTSSSPRFLIPVSSFQFPRNHPCHIPAWRSAGILNHDSCPFEAHPSSASVVIIDRSFWLDPRRHGTKRIVQFPIPTFCDRLPPQLNLGVVFPVSNLFCRSSIGIRIWSTATRPHGVGGLPCCRTFANSRGSDLGYASRFGASIGVCFSQPLRAYRVLRTYVPCTYPVKQVVQPCRSPWVPIDLETADDHGVWGIELSDITCLASPDQRMKRVPNQQWFHVHSSLLMVYATTY